MLDSVRDALANWLRRTDPLPTRASIPAVYGSPVPYSATPLVVEEQPAAPQSWPLIGEQIALRVLAASYQLAAEVEQAEADEEDPGRLDQLYRIDHAVTRIRRQAEILQVLSGRPVDDARRQVTSLLDIVRAAASTVEYYQRVQLGHTADLAVVEFAADDLIRMLTELLDNATRYAPPAAVVLVSAHLTETGSILIRVEDRGVGVPAEQLGALNALLCGGPVPAPAAAGELSLGLQVVARLATTHRMGVSLTARPGGGVTATILVPAPLVCDIPPAVPAAAAESRRGGSHRASAPALTSAGLSSAGPAGIGLAGLGPAGLGPAGFGPAGFGPAGLGAAGLAPAGSAGFGGLAAADLAPAELAPGGWMLPERPTDGENELTATGLPRRVTMSVRGSQPDEPPALTAAPTLGVGPSTTAPALATPGSGSRRGAAAKTGSAAKSSATVKSGVPSAGPSSLSDNGSLPDAHALSGSAAGTAPVPLVAPGSGRVNGHRSARGAGEPPDQPAGRASWADEVAGFAAGYAEGTTPPATDRLDLSGLAESVPAPEALTRLAFPLPVRPVDGATAEDAEHSIDEEEPR